MSSERESHSAPQPEQPNPKQTLIDPEVRDRLVEYATQSFEKNSLTDRYAEVRFEQAGLLEIFEEAGILPKVENPNRIDPNKFPNRHEKWWAEHPEQADQFDQDLRIRNERLRLLWIGARLGRYLPRSTE